MPYSVSGKDARGVNTFYCKTPEVALRKAREPIKRGCYDVRITTPEGRTYHSSEFVIFHVRPSLGDLLKSTRPLHRWRWDFSFRRSAGTIPLRPKGHNHCAEVLVMSPNN